MREDVKACVEARVNFFGQYYEVPPTVQPEVDAFVAQVQELGEQSADAQQFEAAFASTGLSDRFNAILPKCTPKAFEATAEQKEYSKQVRREMWEEQKAQIGQDILDDVTESAMMRAESDAQQQTRRAMSEAGVLDDYTRASNAVEYATEAGGFLAKLFKKKKKD